VIGSRCREKLSGRGKGGTYSAKLLGLSLCSGFLFGVGSEFGEARVAVKSLRQIDLNLRAA